jgi:hypothetical protein
MPASCTDEQSRQGGVQLPITMICSPKRRQKKVDCAWELKKITYRYIERQKSVIAAVGLCSDLINRLGFVACSEQSVCTARTVGHRFEGLLAG